MERRDRAVHPFASKTHRNIWGDIPPHAVYPDAYLELPVERALAHAMIAGREISGVYMKHHWVMEPVVDAMVQAGKAAREVLIQTHIPLAMKFAQSAHVNYEFIDIDDLAQCGYIGLLKTADTFRPEDGNRFITPAGWQIRAEITRLVRAEKKQSGMYAEMDETESPDDHALTTQAASVSVERDTIMRVINGALKTIPEKQRLTILRHIVDGMPHIEIAQDRTIYHKPVGDPAVSAQYTKGIRAVREYLQTCGIDASVLSLW